MVGHILRHIGESIVMGDPQVRAGLSWKRPLKFIKMDDDWGVPLFQETSILVLRIMLIETLKTEGKFMA